MSATWRCRRCGTVNALTVDGDSLGGDLLCRCGYWPSEEQHHAACAALGIPCDCLACVPIGGVTA